VTQSQVVLPLKREERRSWPPRRRANESSIERLQNIVLLHAKLLYAVGATYSWRSLDIYMPKFRDLESIVALGAWFFANDNEDCRPRNGARRLDAGVQSWFVNISFF
jgi:hypothetical protein